MEKIILTGATGFIGSNLAKHLVDLHYEVAVIVRPNSSLDILNPQLNSMTVFVYQDNLDELIEFFQNFHADAVVHLAAYFVAEHLPSQIDRLIDSNIRFSMHIMEAMHQANVKNIINTSTSWQHYDNEEYNPVSLYAATKQAVEDILKYYSHVWDFNCTNLVIYDSFGPNDTRNKIIALFKKIANTSEQLKMSPGEQKIDLIYITDIIDAYVLSLENLFNGRTTGFNKYHLNSGNEKSLKEIATAFALVFGVSLPIVWGERPYRKREVMNSYTLGKRLPGWAPKVSLEEGLSLIKNKNQAPQ